VGQASLPAGRREPAFIRDQVFGGTAFAAFGGIAARDGCATECMSSKAGRLESRLHN
jgi:hypothetical protein